ncbi:MAG: enoyl-CoA hydratase [Proteobacteria bacterium]|nr:enoyl-CoA hydratase [Pseudomonadota bacterium]
MSFNTIIVEKKQSVGIITFNRPKAMNALCPALFAELTEALDELESDDAIAAIIITGDDRAFAAGADIGEMSESTYQQMLANESLSGQWDRIALCRKPVIAAVAGYALGGGCELAMSCDFIIAADNAKFGQPEVTIGTMPGIGGTQRLTRLVGKAKAMDMCLTGRMMDVQEAERAGLVSRIEPLDKYFEVALDTAKQIASFSRPVVKLVKEAVDAALETTLSQGMKTERRLFHSTFAFEDQKEGMKAFIEKRKPAFKNR